MPIYGPIQQSIPAYNPSVLNYLQKTYAGQIYCTLPFSGKRSSVWNHNAKQTSELIIELDSIANEVDKFLNFSLFLENDAYIAGGFAAHATQCIMLNNHPTFTPEYGDVDVYLTKEKFNQLKQSLNFLQLQVAGCKTTPNYNMPLASGKTLQFINMYNRTIEEIANSFDLSVCKAFIDFNAEVLFFDSRITTYPTDLIIDHLNGVVGKNRTFERMNKYLNRYPILANIKMSKECLVDYTIWSKGEEKVAEAKKGISTVSLAKKEVETCNNCKIPLKWIHLDFKCPSCLKVYG